MYKLLLRKAEQSLLFLQYILLLARLSSFFKKRKNYFIVIKPHCLPPWVTTAFHLGYFMQIMLYFQQKIAKIIFYLHFQDVSPTLPNPWAVTNQGQNFSWPTFTLYTDRSFPLLNNKFILPFWSHQNCCYFCVPDSLLFQLILLKTEVI